MKTKGHGIEYEHCKSEGNFIEISIKNLELSTPLTIEGLLSSVMIIPFKRMRDVNQHLLIIIKKNNE